MASHIPSTSYASSFENPFANETPVAQGAAAPSRPMTPVEFENSLKEWVKGGIGTNENRGEASKEILATYDNKTIGLMLDGRGLTTLPDCIGQLSWVVWLNLGFNKITTLPESIGQLRNLGALLLFGNQITTLPRSLHDFWENRKMRSETCQEKYGNVTYFDPEPTPVAASTSASPGQYLRMTTSQKENILSFTDQHAKQAAKGKAPAYAPQGAQVLTRMVLPDALKEDVHCVRFFTQYSQAMHLLFSEKTADALGYSNIEASTWSTVASGLLSASAIPGLSGAGALLTYLSQAHNETKEANKANSILKHFTTPDQFDDVTSHMAVRLTEALQPSLGVLLSHVSSRNPLKQLKAEVQTFMQRCELEPEQHLSRFALLAAMTCMKVLRSTPPADDRQLISDNYAERLSKDLVDKVLARMQIAASPAAVWTDVHEVPSSTQPPRGSDQPAQQSLAEIAEIANAALQTAQSTGAKVNQLAQAVQRQDLLGNGRMQHQTHVNVNIMGGHAVATPHETQRTETAIDPEARQVIRDTNQRVDYHDERLNLIEGVLEGSGQNFSSDASSHYSSTHRYGSGSSTSRRTQMDLNRLPSNWRQAEFTLPNITSISADYLSNHDQANGAVSFTKGQWKVQVKGLRGNLGLTKWKVLSKALQEVHGSLPADRYTIAHDLNTLLVTKLPDPFGRAANILIPANEERLQNSIQTVLGRVQNA